MVAFDALSDISIVALVGFWMKWVRSLNLLIGDFCVVFELLHSITDTTLRFISVK